jgi:hypothetical protein
VPMAVRNPMPHWRGERRLERARRAARREPEAPGVAVGQEIFDCGLPDAYNLMVIRYDELRADRPNAFGEPHEAYWDGSSTSFGGRYAADAFAEEP